MEKSKGMKTTYPTNASASFDDWQKETGASRIYNALKNNYDNQIKPQDKCLHCGEQCAGNFCSNSCKREFMKYEL